MNLSKAFILFTAIFIGTTLSDRNEQNHGLPAKVISPPSDTAVFEQPANRLMITCLAKDQTGLTCDFMGTGKQAPTYPTPTP